MIALVDYGLGNIHAFASVYQRLGMAFNVVRTSAELRDASRVVLPGVGAFDWAMKRLAASGMRDTLDNMVMTRRVPVLGVCVGMQMMMERSEEGSENGLGWIPGDVRSLPSVADTKQLQLPHMGWNDLEVTQRDTLFQDLHNGRFYFLHSYVAVPRTAHNVIAVTNYGVDFASAVRRDNVFGTQFHPEKSHEWGVRLLRNFGEAV